MSQLSIFDDEKTFGPKTRARRDDPHTSKRAAADVAGNQEKLKRRQALVLEMIRSSGPRGMTDEELTTACAQVFGWPAHRSTARTRRAELAELGKVEQAGERPLTSGKPGRVWKIKE